MLLLSSENTALPSSATVKHLPTGKQRNFIFLHLSSSILASHLEPTTYPPLHLLLLASHYIHSNDSQGFSQYMNSQQSHYHIFQVFHPLICLLSFFSACCTQDLKPSLWHLPQVLSFLITYLTYYVSSLVLTVNSLDGSSEISF